MTEPHWGDDPTRCTGCFGEITWRDLCSCELPGTGAACESCCLAEHHDDERSAA